MKFLVRNTPHLFGEVAIPGNKSGTARSIVLGSLADGVTIVHNPLLNVDSFSIIGMFRAMGVEIDTSLREQWVIHGCGGELSVPGQVLDAGNSGTGYYMAAAVAALIDGTTVISGDYQICSRPAQPLIDALNAMGARVYSTRNSGSAPLVIAGRLIGGEVTMPGVNSQWLTPLLIAGSLAPKDTTIRITEEMSEKPYIDMTIGMLKQVGVTIEHAPDYREYHIKGSRRFRATDFEVPADWGSSGYPMIAAAITNSTVTFHNLDVNNYAGERAFVDILQRMGASVEVKAGGAGGITVEGGHELTGIEIDCAGTPDAVPVLAVLGCAAKGKTVLRNVGASRLKETDRTAIIREELEKMGARMEETPDTLTIHESRLRGAFIDGHHDHRIVMAAAVAALVAEGSTTIEDAEYVGVSYPDFYETMNGIGANIERLDVVKATESPAVPSPSGVGR